MSVYRIYAHNKKSLHGKLWLNNMALPESTLAEKYDFALDFTKQVFFRKGVLEPKFEQLAKSYVERASRFLKS